MYLRGRTCCLGKCEAITTAKPIDISVHKLYFNKSERKTFYKAEEQLKSHRLIKCSDLNISVSCFNYI